MKALALLTLTLPLTLFAFTATSRGDGETTDPTPKLGTFPAPDGVRPGGTLTEHFPAPPIAAQDTTLPRTVRNWPQQPPVIPHSIRGYQVDKNFNQCLSCHSRANTQISGAPMVSITHYRARDGQFLAAVSPRRYFCQQCHVPQHDVPPAVGNTFLTMDQVLQKAIEQRQTEAD